MATARGPRKCTLLAVLAILYLFCIIPYAAATLFTNTFLMVRLLFDRFGRIGSSVLFWVPLTSTSILASSLTILFFKLLGEVRTGHWELYGSFHCRKYVVDHLFRYHLHFWLWISSLSGSPVTTSAVYLKQILKALCIRMGKDCAVHASPDILTFYDLVIIGNSSLWGETPDLCPWSIENGYLVKKTICSGNGCYVGAQSVIMGGVPLQDHATVAGFSIAESGTIIACNQTLLGTRVFNISLSKERASPKVTDILETAGKSGPLAYESQQLRFSLQLAG